MNADRPDPSRPEDPDHGLDVDAAFAEIVAHFGPLGEADEAQLPPASDPDRLDAAARGTDPSERSDGPPEDEPEARTDPSRRTGDAADHGPDRSADSLGALFRPAWQEVPEPPASWDDEGHFVPPPPPPLPPMDPRRKLAWGALLGSPLAALLLAVLQVSVPGWAMFFLVVAFVGGFGYLVATMGSSPPDDWTDDGAVV